MKSYLDFRASDQLEGRNLPARGYDPAALHVASPLAEWGLTPGGSTGQTDGPLQPYFMPLEMVSKSVIPEESKALITLPAGRGGRGGAGRPTEPTGPVTLEYAKDWTVAGGRGAPPLQPVDVTA